jgi:hypothetical protein
MQIAKPFKDLIEDNLRFKVVDTCFLVKIDPSVEVFFIVSHHDVQVLLSFFIGNVTPQDLYDKIISEHLYYLDLTVFVSRVLDNSFDCYCLPGFSVSAAKDLSKSALTDKLGYLYIIIAEIG